MIFKRMIEQCGLDRQEAADYLGYSLGAIKKWITGERVLPNDVIAKLAGLNDLIDENANRIASDLSNNSTAIDDQTIHFLEDNLPDLPDFPVDSAKYACLAQAVLIVVAEQMKKKSKTNR